jgi:hypothetical protein
MHCKLSISTHEVKLMQSKAPKKLWSSFFVSHDDDDDCFDGCAGDWSFCCCLQLLPLMSYSYCY